MVTTYLQLSVRSDAVWGFSLGCRVAEWPTDRLVDWQTGRLADWQTGRLADWQPGRGQGRRV
jgi:hypothetical protein